MKATPQQMLRELGYLTSSSGIASFQRDYNLFGSVPVMVSGELDDDTVGAVRLAHKAREAFAVLRKRRSEDRA